VAQAQQYIAEGHGWCVDLDLEKFLDPASYCPLVAEKIRLLLDDLDPQAFASSLSH
jgi:hypothetical protein